MHISDIDYSPIVTDIETCGIDNAAEFIDPPSLEDISAPSNYKDEAKIAAYIEDARAKKLAEFKALCESGSALDWNLGRVAALGYWTERDGLVARMNRDEKDEADSLREFWRKSRRRTIVGFYVKQFDLKFLIQRSRYLDVPHPDLDLGKYSKKSGVIDLFAELTFNDDRGDRAVMRRTLKAFCKRFGIPVNDDIDGKDIPQLVADGKWDDVESHVRSDVMSTLALAKRLQFVRDTVVAA